MNSIFSQYVFANQETKWQPDLNNLKKIEEKRPSIFHKPTKTTSYAQIKYAENLEKKGEIRKAIKQYNALVHSWHNSHEAVTAQFRFACLLENKQKYFRAFNEFQYLIDHYTDRFSIDEVLDHQFRIANHIMTVKHWDFFIFPGFSSPEKALPLFEKIVENASNWGKTPQAQFYIALIHEHLENYDSAIKAYETILQNYAKSSFASKASFGRAECYCVLAEKAPRDEAVWRDALSALAGFLKDYPANQNADMAKQQLETFKEHLADTYYKRAYFYDYISKRPKSAIIAYKDLIKKFPSSESAWKAGERLQKLKNDLKEQKNDI